MTASMRVADGVATLELTRPDRLNTFDLDTARAFSALVARAQDNPEVSCLLLRGEGRVFCGGGDVSEMLAARDGAAYITELADTVHAGVRRLVTGSIPVVAAVQGAAVGAGLALALASDITVAGAGASFRTAYAGIGLSPDCGLSWMLPRRVGEGRALQLLLLDPRLSAAEAHDLGLVSMVVDDEDVQDTAGNVAARLAGQVSHGVTRRLVRKGWSQPLPVQLDAERDAIGRAVQLPETRQLMSRFAR